MTNKLVFAVVVAVGIVRQSQSDGGSAFFDYAVFSRCCQRRGGCHGGGETRRREWAAALCLRVSWWPTATWVEEKHGYDIEKRVEKKSRSLVECVRCLVWHSV
ncbi:hypothetical protein DEO72_LG8g1646 [Vigna unguiculata]|uniref:Secreted protein n=1 Tax=Vigna unguiculata TaxID=3917 RepID=A0A4D6MSK5_VIGUN|nr:hypothetical protein DEO72_LG8g1646 [Vigna unguiculata]